jgi:hypothetical protein
MSGTLCFEFPGIGNLELTWNAANRHYLTQSGQKVPLRLLTGGVTNGGFDLSVLRNLATSEALKGDLNGRRAMVGAPVPGSWLALNPPEEAQPQGQTMTPTATKTRLMTSWDLANAVIPHVRTCLLHGPPGTGKSHLAHMADLDGRPLFSLNLSEEASAGKLEGYFVPKDGEWPFRNGTAINAWTADEGRGGRLVIDEIANSSPACQTFLHRILDAPEHAKISLITGDDVRPGPRFQVIATMNGDPSELLPAPLLDRFEVVIEILEVNPAAIRSLSKDLHDPAMKAIASGRERSLRPWKAFDRLRSAIGDDLAARAAFGPAKGDEILTAIKIASAPETPDEAKKYAPAPVTDSSR